MEGVKIFDDIEHRDGLKATDKLLVGNIDNGAVQHATVQEIIDLVPSDPGGGQQTRAYVGMANYHFYTPAFYIKVGEMSNPDGCLAIADIFGTGDNRVYSHAVAMPPVPAGKITVQRFDPAFEMVVVFYVTDGGPSEDEIGNTYTMSGNQWPSSYPTTYDIPPAWGPFSMKAVIRRADNAPIAPGDMDMLQWTITTGDTLSDWFPNWYEQLINLSSGQ